jgi:hypothetical protein
MSTTANYGWTKPTVAGDTDAWGGELNADLDAIDTALKAVSVVANAAVPNTGTGMIGRLDLLTSTTVHVDLGTTNAPALNFSLANSFSFTPTAGYAPVISNVPVGTSPILLVPLLLEVINGGAFAPTWPAGFKFPAGSVPSLTTSGRDIMAFVCRDGTNFRFLGITKNV